MDLTALPPAQNTFAAVAAAVVVSLTGGCGLIVGADDYRVEAAPDAAGGAGSTTSVEPPLLPTKPDENFVPSCEECAAEKCDTYRTACLASERCRALLACHGECDDPNCIYRCRDTEPESATFDDYFGCVFGPLDGNHYAIPRSNCLTECNVGSNWECAGDYAWDLPQPDGVTMDLLLQIAGTEAQVGSVLATYGYAEVAACNDLAAPENLTGDGGCDVYHRADAYGRVTLELGSQRRAFAIRGGDAQELRARIYHRPPAARSGHEVLRAFNDGLWQGWVANQLEVQQGPAVDRNLGIVTFFARDCTGAPAYVRVTLEGADAASAFRFYWRDSDGTIDVGDEAQLAGAYVNVRPNPSVEIVGRKPNADELVARRFVVAASDWVTHVTLWPIE